MKPLARAPAVGIRYLIRAAQKAVLHGFVVRLRYPPAASKKNVNTRCIALPPRHLAQVRIMLHSPV
ncbi:hypothetical protein [Xanthobacter sediminis]|uniref:hypothetical protein n=1 Tax=Xanthobacter sediminis TaxID=3119926 RepID=UPI00372B678E